MIQEHNNPVLSLFPMKQYVCIIQHTPFPPLPFFPPFFFLLQEMQEVKILVVMYQTDASISAARLHSIYELFRV